LKKRRVKMGVLLEKARYTYEDYLKTPDDARYELIDGELLMSPSPSTRHQRIVGRLYFYILRHLMENHYGEVFIAPYDVVINNYNVIQPDILFISKERLDLVKENNIQGAPDLIVEVLSEATAYRDTIQKKILYARAGVKEYWIVAPDEKLVEVYNITHEGEYRLTKTYHEDDTLESVIIKDLRIVLKEVW